MAFYINSLSNFFFSLEQLPIGSTVYSIDASDGEFLYIGGDFASLNSTGFRNIVSYNNQLGQLLSLDNNSFGLNGIVSKVLLSNSSKFQSKNHKH